MYNDMKQPTDYGKHDHEASMARGELYNAIKNAMEIFQMIESGENLEGWVAAKITKAADYLNSVHDYMVYEKKYGTNEPVDEEYLESLEKNLQTQLLEERKKWVQKAVKGTKKDALRKQEGKKKGEKFSKSELKNLAAHGTPKEKKRAQFALNISKKK
jgi:hypothetical protein